MVLLFTSLAKVNRHSGLVKISGELLTIFKVGRPR